MKLTAENLLRAIATLPKNTWFNYVNERTQTKVQVVRIQEPEGPIYIRRLKRDGSQDDCSISKEMLWRAANAIGENVPINFERVFGSSYNTRSALEALLAHTSEFYWCKPGRIELIHDSSRIKEGHKHLVWKPSQPHQKAVMYKVEGIEAISELPTQLVSYDSLTGVDVAPADNISAEVKRRHLQMQIRLIEIGCMLGFRTWVAQNDKGYQYGDQKIGMLDGVIGHLSEERVLSAFPEAINAAKLIDCVWFKNGRFMPAVMEVEHSTGITSGLNRMKKFQELGPALRDVRWVIVAADEDRAEVLRKANDPQFASLDTKYFSYGAVEELYDLCKRRGVTNLSVNEGFIDCFMESCVSSQRIH
jgi:type II restriction enzyme